MLRKSRQFGEKNVSMFHCGTKLCLAMYQLFRKHLTRVSDERKDVTELLVGQSEESAVLYPHGGTARG